MCKGFLATWRDEFGPEGLDALVFLGPCPAGLLGAVCLTVWSGIGFKQETSRVYQPIQHPAALGSARGSKIWKWNLIGSRGTLCCGSRVPPVWRASGTGPCQRRHRSAALAQITDPTETKVGYDDRVIYYGFQIWERPDDMAEGGREANFPRCFSCHNNGHTGDSKHQSKRMNNWRHL